MEIEDNIVVFDTTDAKTQKPIGMLSFEKKKIAQVYGFYRNGEFEFAGQPYNNYYFSRAYSEENRRMREVEENKDRYEKEAMSREQERANLLGYRIPATTWHTQQAYQAYKAALGHCNGMDSSSYSQNPLYRSNNNNQNNEIYSSKQESGDESDMPQIYKLSRAQAQDDYFHFEQTHQN